MYAFFKPVIKSFHSKRENWSLVFVSLPVEPSQLWASVQIAFWEISLSCSMPVWCLLFYLTSILGTAVSSHVLDNPNIFCFLKSPQSLLLLNSLADFFLHTLTAHLLLPVLNILR